MSDEDASLSTARREPDRAPTNPSRAPWFALLAVFFLVRYDLWAQNDATLVAGVPIGLAYHVAYCLAAVGVLALLVRYAWPDELDTDAIDTDESPDGTDAAGAAR